MLYPRKPKDYYGTNGWRIEQVTSMKR